MNRHGACNIVDSDLVQQRDREDDDHAANATDDDLPQWVRCQLFWPLRRRLADSVLRVTNAHEAFLCNGCH
jgi:hypothetical protein